MNCFGNYLLWPGLHLITLPKVSVSIETLRLAVDSGHDTELSFYPELLAFQAEDESQGFKVEYCRHVLYFFLPGQQPFRNTYSNTVSHSPQLGNTLSLLCWIIGFQISMTTLPMVILRIGSAELAENQHNTINNEHCRKSITKSIWQPIATRGHFITGSSQLGS